MPAAGPDFTPPLPLHKFLVYFITPDYYQYESETMIQMGVRSGNGKIVKDHDRIKIMIDNFLIEVPLEKDDILKFFNQLWGNINGTPKEFRNDLKKVVYLIVLATNVQLVTKLTCTEYSKLNLEMEFRQMVDLIDWAESKSGGGGNISINNQYGGGSFEELLLSLSIPFKDLKSKEPTPTPHLASVPSAAGDQPEEPEPTPARQTKIGKFLQKHTKLINRWKKLSVGEHLSPDMTDYPIPNWNRVFQTGMRKYLSWSTGNITDDELQGILDDWGSIYADRHIWYKHYKYIEYSPDSTQMLEFKINEKTIDEILEEMYIDDFAVEVPYTHLPLKKCLCYDKPSATRYRGGGYKKKLVKMKNIVKINNQFGGAGDYSKLIIILFGEGGL